MPTTTGARRRVRAVPKLTAGVAVAAVVGVGIGSVLFGSDTSDRALPDVVGPKRQSPSPQVTRARVQVVTAFLQPALAPRGRRRHRARLSVHVRVTNDGKVRIEDLAPLLVASGKRVAPDPLASDTTGSLLRPLAPGATAGGRLRFETAGAVTDQLAKARRGVLQIAGGTVPFELKMGRPPQ